MTLLRISPGIWRGPNLTRVPPDPEIVTGNIPAGPAGLKTTQTSRVNTTTYADDPALIVNLRGPARYVVDFLLVIRADTSTPAMKIQFAYTGTGDIGMIAGSHNDAYTPTTALLPLGPTDLAEFFVGNAGYNNESILMGTMWYITTTGGDLSIQWAQNTIDAVNSLYMEVGSYLRAVRIE